MNSRLLSLGIVTDTNCDILARFLANGTEQPAISVETSPYGQAMQVLLDDNHPFWHQKYDFLLIWIQPGLVESDFVLFQELLSQRATKHAAVFVPSFFLPPWEMPHSISDFKRGGKEHNLIAMNHSLIETGSKLSNCFVLPTHRWLATLAGNPFSPKLWFATKQLYSNTVFLQVAKELKAAILALKGASRKLLILDLDNTLWGGEVGELGWNQINLGGVDPVGEAFVSFQKIIKQLKDRGILLAIVSKNEESVALEVMDKHPAMILRKEDFVSWRINWNDKAENVKQILNEVHLTPESAVFIDDSPAERGRVASAFPSLLVPDFKNDPTAYALLLTELNCFDKPSQTKEDLERTQMIIQDKKRNDLKTSVSSLNDWIQSLGIKCVVEPLNPDNLVRATQLLNKTNQMNLSSQRLTEQELLDWSSQATNSLITFRVQDKFGDYGLTGILGISHKQSDLVLEHYLLSCRVMGRQIEETMLGVAQQIARKNHCTRIVAKYAHTDRNLPCFNFFKSCGFFKQMDSDTFVWDLEAQSPTSPSHVTLEWDPI